MGNVQNRIICPNPEHKEDTASCVVYEDGSGYCFGCFSYFKSLAKPINITNCTQKEDLSTKVKYIESLPTTLIRGLTLPYDNQGYYILWPNKDYYKIRHWLKEPKYVGAKGHTKPWFTIPPTSPSKRIILIEGEINALSLQTCDLPLHIISPGGAGNFVDKQFKNNLGFFKQYDEINIVVDNDDAGINAAIRCKELLHSVCLFVKITLLDEDCNETLVKYGKEAITTKFRPK